LAAAAATAALPMLSAAAGAARSARGAGRSSAAATAEKPGWITTTLKAADLKDNEFTAVAGHAIVVARAGKTVAALTTKCTHSGCSMTPKASAKTLTCTCHKSEFNLDGTVAHAPATQPLSHYAIRMNDKGLIEIDPGQQLTKDNKSATITVS
jgi:Rieske Fe-S protein